MTVYQRRDDWVGTQVEDHLVMINVDSGRYVALNETAADAWHLLEKPLDRKALVEAMTERFAIDAKTCGQSVDTLIERMHRLDLVSQLA